MVGVLWRQNLVDQRLGRDAAFDDPGGRRCLDDSALVGAATVARATRHQHAQRDRRDVEPTSGATCIMPTVLQGLRTASPRGVLQSSRPSKSKR